MRKATLVLVFVALAMLAVGVNAAEPAKSAKPEAPRFMNDLPAAMKAAAEKQRPLIVDFYADW